MKMNTVITTLTSQRGKLRKGGAKDWTQDSRWWHETPVLYPGRLPQPLPLKSPIYSCLLRFLLVPFKNMGRSEREPACCKPGSMETAPGSAQKGLKSSGLSKGWGHHGHGAATLPHRPRDWEPGWPSFLPFLLLPAGAPALSLSIIPSLHIWEALMRGQ